MLLTITYEGQNAENLGYLLHKNPMRAQQFALNYGKAYVFYPEATSLRTTAALLLDIDPIDLARGKADGGGMGLFDYVNDRPYASTSFMSTAIARVFGTAMSGKCEKLPALANTPLPLTARLSALHDGGLEELASLLFSPLGYTVKTSREILDERFPEWGKSPYITLELKGTVRLSELLNHLYVLIPVFDRKKHYYYEKAEIEKLIAHGEGWLSSHPQKELIARRYFSAKKSYARKAIDLLVSSAEEEESDSDEEKEEEKAFTPLNALRLNAVKEEVLKSGAESVIDLGCGECRLTALLLVEPQIKRLTACDVSAGQLEKAAKRLKLERMAEYKRKKLTLMQASLTYKDDRFSGYDCACIVEVIEHIEPMRLSAMERSVFLFASPKTVIVTTPNREYNEHYASLTEGKLRHGDHRFEWTRQEFKEWTDRIAKEFGYSCKISGIGEEDERSGAPTQMGVFTKNG